MQGLKGLELDAIPGLQLQRRTNVSVERLEDRTNVRVYDVEAK